VRNVLAGALYRRVNAAYQLALALMRLLRPAPPPPDLPGETELRRAAAIVARAPAADAALPCSATSESRLPMTKPTAPAVSALSAMTAPPLAR
jgi:hypothetical protein